MDADAFSMTHQLQDFVQYRDDPNIPTASKEHLRLMSNDDLITAAVILNLVVFWTIDPRGSGDVDEMHRSSHPHPLMRLYMNAETVLACAARVLDLPHSATVETLRNTQLGVIHTLGKGAGINRSIGINLKDDIARIYVPYRDNLRTVWQERRKQLMKVKYYPDLQTHLL